MTRIYIGTRLRQSLWNEGYWGHSLVDHACLQLTCKGNYLGETGRRIIERLDDHCGKDKQSHILIYALNHKIVGLKDFKIIGSYHQNNRLNRKISEAPHIKQYKQYLKTQDQ